jgi:hypothetical protein
MQAGEDPNVRGVLIKSKFQKYVFRPVKRKQGTVVHTSQNNLLELFVLDLI